MSDERTQDDRAQVSVARGTFLGVRADVVSALSMIVVSVVVSRALGPENRGIFFLALAVALLLALIGDLGMSAAGIVFSSNRRVHLASLHGVALCFSLLAGAVGTGLMLGLEGFWTSNVLTGLDTVTLALLSAGIAPLLYSQVMLAVLTGAGHIPITATLRIGQALVYVGLVTPAAIATGSARWTLAAWLATTVAFALSIGAYTAQRLSRPRWPGRAVLRTVLGFGARGYVGTLAHQGFLRVDVFFLSARYGPAVVGVYSLAAVVAERISLLGQAVYGASASRMGSYGPERAAQLTAELVRALLVVLLPTAAALAVLGWPGFGLVFGEDFESAALPFAILLPGTVALTLWYLVSLYIVSALERPMTTTLIQGGALVASVPLYLVAVRAWEMTGAAAVSAGIYLAVLAMGVGVFLSATGCGIADLLPHRSDLGRVIALVKSALRR